MFRRHDEHRLRQVELPRDGLHLPGIEVIGIAYDGQRIARELLSREDVEDVVSQAHDGPPGLLGFVPIGPEIS